MKKYQKEAREIEKLKKQLKNTRSSVERTKDSKLWNHEAGIRKKIRKLNEMSIKHSKEFGEVYDGYLRLLDIVSERILRNYNLQKRTRFYFEEVIGSNREAYISSGIMSVLITSHIPKLIAKEFERRLPADPKDEYPKARKKKRSIILHLGDTNTGKTYKAVERLKSAKKGVYLAPLRILALENYEKLNREGVPCNLITGEEEILVEGAQHVCSTVEKLDVDAEYDIAVIDEIQMIANSQRGQAWTRALLGIQCAEIHVCGAINAKELILRLIEDCGDTYEVNEYTRKTPLEVIYEPFSLKKIEKGDAIVAFSKKKVLYLSKFFSERGVSSSVIYGDLPPEVRRMQYQAFLSGKNKILVTTDAIGMGVNLPIRRIIFTGLQKYDGEEVRYLSTQEIKQIAGRAGRKGIYDVGYVGIIDDDIYFCEDSLKTKDSPIERAVLGPSEAITGIPGLPLKEKLALWSTGKTKSDYYTKMDVRDYLLILESIRQYRLPEEIEYKLMILPFDVNDTELLCCFLNYVEEIFIRGQKSISRPAAPGARLFDMERYYQMLNLFYSFSRSFGLKFDPAWVYEERLKVSDKINSLLLRL